jgi:hypothetical protein
MVLTVSDISQVFLFSYHPGMVSKLTIQDDFTAFHAAHFSSAVTNHFSEQFLGPVDEEYYEEEDDGLGYYDDGVKRTLTDEQIAIFRHSEIEALRRERRHAEEAKEDGESPVSVPVFAKEEGEIDSETFVDVVIDEVAIPPAAPSALTLTPAPAIKSTHANEQRRSNKKAKKAQQAREKGWFKQNIKPDLRKRTWDKVETGMESLDYDEESSNTLKANPVSQRRRIFYDD